MTELERVHDAEVVEEDIWEAAVSEWATGHSEELKGKLRQARAAAAVRTRYGAGSMEAFAQEVGASRSKVYAFAAAYRKLIAWFETHEEISKRLNDSPLRISNVLEASHEDDVPKALDEAEDEKLTSRQQRARRKEKEVPKNVELVEIVTCPRCDEEYPLSEAMTRKVER